MTDEDEKTDCTENQGRRARIVSSSVCLALSSLFIITICFGELIKNKKCTDTTLVIHETDRFLRKDQCYTKIPGARPRFLFVGGPIVIDNSTHSFYAMPGNLECEESMQLMQIPELKKKVMLSCVLVVASTFLLVARKPKLNNFHPAIYTVAIGLASVAILRFVFEFRS